VEGSTAAADDGGGGGAPLPSAPEAAAQKLMMQLSAVQASERDACSALAEERQRERLGKLMHDMELANAIRDDPLGYDRRYNRYRWYGKLVGTEQRLLPDRILFENGATGDLGMLTHADDIAVVRGMLDTKGARESSFARALDCHAEDMAATLAASGSAPVLPLALPPALEERPEAEVTALRDSEFQRLLKVETAGMMVLGDDGEVRATDYLPDDPPAVRKIKGEMLCVESAIPVQAMVHPDWNRVEWIRSAQARPCLHLVALPPWPPLLLRFLAAALPSTSYSDSCLDWDRRNLVQGCNL
jgi:hypothetical protein